MKTLSLIAGATLLTAGSSAAALPEAVLEAVMDGLPTASSPTPGCVTPIPTPSSGEPSKPAKLITLKDVRIIEEVTTVVTIGKPDSPTLGGKPDFSQEVKTTTVAKTKTVMLVIPNPRASAAENNTSSTTKPTPISTPVTKPITKPITKPTFEPVTVTEGAPTTKEPKPTSPKF